MAHVFLVKVLLTVKLAPNIALVPTWQQFMLLRPHPLKWQ